MPSRYVDPLHRDEGQDFCLDMTDMAALKVDVIKQGIVEPGHACCQQGAQQEDEPGEQGNSGCRSNMLTPSCREQSQQSLSWSATC